jgi:hypothetical protein
MSLISKALGITLLGSWMAMPAVAAPQFVAVQPVPGARVVIGPRLVTGPRVVVRSYVPFGRFGYYGPGWYYPTYSIVPNTGEVKIDTHLKDASLFVDGGYVGPINKFKRFSLSPGNHDIELRDAYGDHIFDQRVHVIVGKSVEVRAAT